MCVAHGTDFVRTSQRADKYSRMAVNWSSAMCQCEIAALSDQELLAWQLCTEATFEVGFSVAMHCEFIVNFHNSVRGIVRDWRTAVEGEYQICKS